MLINNRGPANKTFLYMLLKDYSREEKMRNKLSLVNLFFVFFLLLLFTFTGCQGMGFKIDSRSPHPKVYSEDKDTGPPPWAPAHGRRVKYTYRYYPGAHVYYEGGRGVYFYYRDGQWQVSATIPVGIRIDIDNFVTLEMDTDKPYEYHDEVVKRYPAGQQKNKKKKKGKEK